MLSLIYFAVYTAVAILSLVFPSAAGWWCAAACVLTVGMLYMKIVVPFGFVKRIKEDEIHFYNLCDILDLPYGTAYFISGVFIAAVFAPFIMPPLVTVWVYYIATVAVNYVFPAVRSALWRIRLYMNLRGRGCRVSVSLYELIFSGRDGIQYITVESPKETYKIGILGGSGQMRYIIDGGKITSQRVNPMLREGILEFERVDSKVVNLWTRLFAGRQSTCELHIEEDGDFLMLHPNAFIQTGAKILEIGDPVCNMHLVDITDGAKYISTGVFEH